MLIDLYSFFSNSPELKQRVIGSGYLTAEYKCPIDVENFRFWNEMHFITYIISGKKDWFCDGEKYELKGGDAAFIKKGVYSTKQYFEVDHCIIGLMLNDDFIRNFLAEYNSIKLPTPNEESPKGIYTIDVNDEIQSIILSISNYLKQGREIPSELVEIKFKELLFALVLNPQNRSLAQYFSTIQHSENASLEYIMKKHFQEDLNLEDFARMCGKSLSSFKRDFRECFKQSPGKWLTEQRLNHAKTLLESSSMSISEICYGSGFKNASHFNKAFKDQFNLPPLQYRQQLSS